MIEREDSRGGNGNVNDENRNQARDGHEMHKIHGFMDVFSSVGSKALLDYMKSRDVVDKIQDELEKQCETLILGKEMSSKGSANRSHPQPKHERRVAADQYEDLAETDEAGYEEYHSTISCSTHNPETVRTTPLYSVIRRSVEWQRDNYLIGQQFADRRKKERANDTFYTKLLGSRTIFSLIPNTDMNALGLIQITGLAPSFLSSRTVYNSARPLVSALPYGALREPVYQATATLIPASQNTLDEVVKASLIQVFHNDQFKELVRSSFRNQAEGYLFKNIPDVESQSEYPVPSFTPTCPD
jgi:hypothetical protein